MYCKYCGEKTSNEAIFCEKCGKSTKDVNNIAGTINKPMLLNIVTLCILALYIILMCTTWYTVEISFGYSMGEEFTVGLFSAMECSDSIAEMNSDWGYLFGEEMEATLNVLQIASTVMFFAGIAEFAIAVVNVFVIVSKMGKSKELFYPCAWGWLDIVPIAAIGVPIALGNIINSNTERMVDITTSSTMYILLILCVVAEFVLNMFIGSKYTAKNISSSWVNNVVSSGMTDSSAKEILTKPITLKKKDGCGDDQWECTSCGRRFALDIPKCTTCNLKKEDCIAQMEREKRRKK